MEKRGFKESPQLVESRTIEGYAIVFGQESRVMYDFEKRSVFIEIIEKGAVSEELLRKCDVKALINHDSSKLLARSDNGEGTLMLSVDEHGVKYRFDAPNTNDGDWIVEMVKRGDIKGSSFAFTRDINKDADWDFSEKIPRCRVKNIRKIYDVGPVTDPAYLGTDVKARSLQELGLDEGNEPSWKDQLEQQKEQFKKYL